SRQARSTTPEQLSAERQNTAQALVAGVRAIRASNAAACIVFATVAAKPANVPTYATEANQINTLIQSTAADPQFGGNIQVAGFAAAARTQCPSDWQTNPSRTCDLFG